jgi:hypothetical protein
MLGISSVYKMPVRLSTIGNINLKGNQLIDGVMTVENDRVLVRRQTNGVENGIYTTNTNDWRRSSDLPTGSNA